MCSHSFSLHFSPQTLHFCNVMILTADDFPNSGHTFSMKEKRKIIINEITKYTFLFFLTSMAGFLWEVLLYLVREGRFRNRGFFYGPWLPVYGAGAVLILLLLRRLQKHPFYCFLLSAAIGTGVELLIGWMLNTFWGLRYWDYSGQRFNWNGYICLTSALGFGAAGALWVCCLSILSLKLWHKIPKRVQLLLITVLFFLFITDIAAALIFPNAGRGITS